MSNQNQKRFTLLLSDSSVYSVVAVSFEAAVASIMEYGDGDVVVIGLIKEEEVGCQSCSFGYISYLLIVLAA